MSGTKYVGMDVHKATTVVAVLDANGKLIQQAILETKSSTIRDFFRGLSGRVHATFEEGTQADWLFDLISPLVAKLVVGNARETASSTVSNKGDKRDAAKLARQLRAGDLKAVYHGHRGTRTLKYLVGTYGQLVEDTTRIKNRIKAIYRGNGISCSGKSVYRAEQRAEWLAKLEQEGQRLRAELLLEQLDSVRALQARASLLMRRESRKHAAEKLIRSAPGMGPLRTAQALAIIDTPHRFRTKRQLWAYAGLAVVTRGSAEYRLEDGQVRRQKRAVMTRGLNRNANRRLKQVFKGAANTAIGREPIKSYYERLIGRGLKPELARVTVARKIAAVVLSLWKRGEVFDERKLMTAAS